MTTTNIPLLARLKDGALAGAVGWLAGLLISFPFKFAFAWRYVDGHVGLLPGTLAEGILVWAVFTLFMAVAGFLPLFLPLVVLIPARWVVRLRFLLIPLAAVAAEAAINFRMGLLNAYHFEHAEEMRAFLFTAPNFFVVAFAPIMVWFYVRRAQRRIEAK